MRRRLLLSAATSILAAPAVLAQPGRVPRIGALFAADEHFFPDLLRRGLEQRGWRPGSYVLEIRSGGGRGDRLDALAKELVAAKVDVILAIQTPAGLAAQRATREIPIVVTAADPIGTGLVISIARPEGNVTGIDNAGTALQIKRVELLKEILPQMRRLGAMVNPADPFHKPYLAQTQEAAAAFGLAVEPVLVTDTESGLRDLLGRNVDAVLIQPSLPLPILAPRLREARMPAMSGSPAFVKAGGLLALHADLAEIYRLLSVTLDRLLKGASPRDIPLMQPSQFELMLNLATARILGVTFPPSIVNRADEVIE